ncbi:DoxX family protein [Mucilaginibacter rubeus]|uniref:DoxX family protein n=1 Tax=Mucilaginibacter rubeus TaxID=2027860 RepID=A0A5C1HZN1_9SPHI|nr:DoxX family protein [Mucilaginibacter rubeus]QEM10451.1 DoxX family protein [Mucilaginibacter rubeus]
MKPKTIKILYWTFTTLFLLAMLGDAYGGITMQQAGKDSLAKLGYPMYLLVIMGSAKIAGVLAIAQTKYKVIKEWAYSGFTISFIGAFLSWFAIGAGGAMLVPPVVMLIVMFFTYYLWKKYEQVKDLNVTNTRLAGNTELA